MKKQFASALIFIFLFSCFNFNSTSGALTEVQTSTELMNEDNFLTIGNLSWTAGSFNQGADPLLDTPSVGDSFDYSISDNEIFVQEIDSNLAAVGVYATVPVNNSHLIYSCYFRAKANHPDARKMYVYYYDSTSLELISGLPTLRYYNDDKTTDTGFNFVTMDIPLVGYDEVIMFICYYDAWIADLEQTLWVKDLKIYTDGILPSSEPAVEDISPLDTLNWTVGSFLNEAGEFEDLVPIKGEEGKFISSINETHIYLAENGTGVDYARIGAYITIPVHLEKLRFSFSAYGTASTHANIRHLLYNPISMEQITKQPTVQFQNTPGENILNYTIEIDVNIADLREVILFFYFVDSYSTNQNHRYWITDIKIAPTEYLGIGDLDWTIGLSDLDVYNFEMFNDTGFGFELNDSYIHLEETTGTNGVLLGAAAEVPVTNNTLCISLEGRAKANHIDPVRLRFALYDPITLKEIKWWSLIRSGDEPTLDTGFRYFEKKFYLEGYTSVILHFYQGDGWSANWNQEFWVTNLCVYTDTDSRVILRDSISSFVTSPSSESYGLTWYNDNLWTINYRTKVAYQINPETRETVANWSLPTNNAVGLTTSDNGFLYSDIVTGLYYTCNYSFDINQTITPSFLPNSGMVYVDGYIWAAHGNDNTIHKIDSSDGSIVISYSGPGQKAKGLAFDGFYLWVTDIEENKIYQIVPESGAIISYYDVPFDDPWGITVDDEGYIWVCDAYSSIIYKLDIQSIIEIDTISPDLSWCPLLPPGGNKVAVIEWTISDSSNSGHYWLYLNGTLLEDNLWLSPTGDFSFYTQISHYALGTYNFTLVATDTYFNKATLTVIYTIEEPTTDTDFISIIMVLASLGILVIPVSLKKRKP